MSSSVASYLNLTKPRIVVLFAVTGLIGYYAEGVPLPGGALSFWALVIGLMLTAASANAFNMFIDQDIDAIMDRTRFKRSIPLGLRTGKDALVLGFTAGALAIALLSYFSNWYAGLLSLFTILFYALVYTMWLKRTTHHNTFWGGIPGAMAPIIASAATNGGQISPLAWSLFAIIMVWEPPHFWALAITLREDYAKAKIPMLPVRFGEEYTKKSILAYTLVLAPVSLLPFIMGDAGFFYAGGVSMLNAAYIYKTIRMLQVGSHAYCKHLFHVSLLYITWLFVFLLLDVSLF